MDYCTAGPQFASGGFIADSRTGTVINGSQQQFLRPRQQLGGWSNGVWNQVFSGVPGRAGAVLPERPAVHDAGHHPGEQGEAVPVRRRRAARGQVFVPGARDELAPARPGRTGRPPGRSIPLSDFFLARPSDSVKKIDIAARPGQEPALHARRVRRSTAAIEVAAGHGRARPRASRR